LKHQPKRKELATKHLVGLDLHSNNVCGIIADPNDRWVLKRKFPTCLKTILSALGPYKGKIGGVVVEATATWYWLVDGLEESGYKVHLANPAALDGSKGKKRTNDFDDAFKLIQLLRDGKLREGYIYPKDQRPIRDLMRKRSFLVRSRTKHMLNFMNMVSRNKGFRLSSNQVKQLSEKNIEDLFEHKFLKLSASSSVSVINHFANEIKRLEKPILKEGRLKPEFKRLLDFPGIGDTIGLTIAFEAGTLSRFPSTGDYLSYCRCVDSKRLTNGKKKGENNRKNGNAYLCWAYVEAANFAKRYCPYAGAYFNHKLKQTGMYVIAIKALASKIARATFYMMTKEVDYDPQKVFGSYKAQAKALIKKQKP